MKHRSVAGDELRHRIVSAYQRHTGKVVARGAFKWFAEWCQTRTKTVYNWIASDEVKAGPYLTVLVLLEKGRRDSQLIEQIREALGT